MSSGSAQRTVPDAATRAEIAELASAAAKVDGREPFTEQTQLLLASSTPRATHVVRRDAAGRVVGYGQRDGAGTAELAVHPDARRAGHGRALLDALLTRAGAGPDGGLRIWAHAASPAAAALARSCGLVPVRELWRMHRTLPLDPTHDPPGPVPLPAGVSVRTFVPGRDEPAWLALNSAAFATHGEQGRLDRADLDARLAAPWFDADGFFLAERDGRLVGFHWTKVHPPGRAGEPALGEIYVLGVDPGGHGGGLGRALSRIGLRYLAGLGLAEVLLYVDADNTAAVAVYTRLGFRTQAASVLYAEPAAPS